MTVDVVVKHDTEGSEKALEVRFVDANDAAAILSVDYLAPGQASEFTIHNAVEMRIRELGISEARIDGKATAGRPVDLVAQAPEPDVAPPQTEGAAA